MENKACIICTTEFTNVRKKTKCCSNKCRTILNHQSSVKRRAKSEHTKECKICETVFIGYKNTSFCGKECYSKHKTIYIRNRYQSNLNYRLADILRSRLSKSLKSGSAVKDLGCTVDELITYLESKFLDNMSWDNYGHKGWHIDHIKPLAGFDLSDREQLKEACHYTNLQPLWAIDNLKKGKK